MAMKCIACGRHLSRPALVTGAYAWGPKCAKRAGLVEPKTRTRHEEAKRDELTRDLFEGVK